MTGRDVARRLDELGYSGAFLSPSEGNGERLLDRDGGSALRDVVADADASESARFLAAELLATRGQWPPGVPPDVLAGIYVQALRADVTGIANPWAFPHGVLGPLGDRLVSLGRAAVDPLVSALDDPRPLWFIGSREASVGNSYEWRVKDAAAVILAAVSGAPFEADLDPAARDAAIEELRRYASDSSERPR